MTKIYRRRVLTDETIWLKDDIILRQDADIIITKWNSLKPRPDFSHGLSCYFLHKNYKISKFFDHSGAFLYYYCDIIKACPVADGIVFCDLLVDIILYPGGGLRVLDLDELAGAAETGAITFADMLLALRTADTVLHSIYNNEFLQIASVLEEMG